MMRNISKEPCNIPKFVLIGIILLYQRSAQKTTKWIERKQKTKKLKTKTANSMEAMRDQNWDFIQQNFKLFF